MRDHMKEYLEFIKTVNGLVHSSYCDGVETERTVFDAVETIEIEDIFDGFVRLPHAHYRKSYDITLGDLTPGSKGFDMLRGKIELYESNGFKAYFSLVYSEGSYPVFYAFCYKIISEGDE